MGASLHSKCKSRLPVRRKWFLAALCSSLMTQPTHSISTNQDSPTALSLSVSEPRSGNSIATGIRKNVTLDFGKAEPIGRIKRKPWHRNTTGTLQPFCCHIVVQDDLTWLLPLPSFASWPFPFSLALRLRVLSTANCKRIMVCRM